MRKMILALAIMATSSLAAFSQDTQKAQIENQTQDKTYSYAYISVQGKLFSKKLYVQVDFGDTPDKINAGKEYSEMLTDKKSYAAVLNYMVEKEFELVSTLALTENFQGSGGTSGIIFIMKKKK